MDALTRKIEPEEATLCLISFPTVDWLTKLKRACERDTRFQELISIPLPRHYNYRDGLLLYKGQIYIPNDESFKIKLLELVHSSALGGPRRF